MHTCTVFTHNNSSTELSKSVRRDSEYPQTILLIVALRRVCIAHQRWHVHQLWNEFHFFLVCPLYNRNRVTLQNAMGNIAPFSHRTLLHRSENLDLTVNKRIVTETLRFIKDSKRFDPWLHDSVLCRVHVLTVCFVIRCKYLICHHLIDVHLYKFFTCLDINKTCLNQLGRFFREGWQSFKALARILTLTLPGPSASVSGSLDSYCSLKPLCSGMGEVVSARTSPTLLPPSPRTVLSLSYFKVLQCINCRD